MEVRLIVGRPPIEGVTVTLDADETGFIANFAKLADDAHETESAKVHVVEGSSTVYDLVKEIQRQVREAREGGK